MEIYLNIDKSHVDPGLHNGILWGLKAHCDNLKFPTFKFLDFISCFFFFNYFFFQINPDTLELVEEEVASCDEILAQEVSNIKAEKSSVKEMPSLNLSVNSTPEKNSQSNENLQIKTPPEVTQNWPSINSLLGTTVLKS